MEAVQGTKTPLVADYDWYADGLLQKVSYQNGSSRNYIYDDADRVTNITNNFGNDQSESFDYAYDANSNRTNEVKKANGQTFRTLDYQYDTLDRLSQVKTSTPNGGNPAIVSQIDYTYDAVGNRKTEIGTDQNGVSVNRTATFDDLNQLTRLSSGSLTEVFEYDANGNLTTHKQNNAEVVRYEYDGRNQLTKYEGVGSGINVTFDYDFEKKRLSKTSANFQTDYVYAGNQIVSEYQGNVNSATYTIGGGEIVRSEFASGENNFHFTDAPG